MSTGVAMDLFVQILAIHGDSGVTKEGELF